MTPKIRLIEILDLHLLDTDDKMSFIGIADLKINGEAVSYTNDAAISEVDLRMGFMRCPIVDPGLKSKFDLDDEEYAGLIAAIHGLSDPYLAEIWLNGPYHDMVA